jgi:hypothetical protein
MRSHALAAFEIRQEVAIHGSASRARIFVALKLQFNANQGRLSKELHQALGLARASYQSIKLLALYHCHAILASPRDGLRHFIGSSTSFLDGFRHGNSYW